ncbi:glycoside hydrolase family 28 protein [Hymenobacter terrigena]
MPTFASRTFNVKDFGATGDGQTNDTQAINQAIEQCNKAGGGTITFPAGRYVAASIHLKSNIRFALDGNAELYGAASGYDAPESHEPYEKYQDYGHSHFHNALMWGEDIVNFAIEGGKVTGGPIIQGDPKGRDIGDKVIVIVRGKNLMFKNVTHDTGGHFVYLLNDCENILLDHVVIKKSRDAVDFMGCRNVQVVGCHFTGCVDDTIGIKSDYVLGRRIASANFYIWDCYFESGCNGIQFGSETAGDFKNIRAWSIKINLAMKAGLGITSNDSGVIEDVEYRDIEIKNAANPIFILITDRLRTGEAGAKVGKIKNVKISNVTIAEQRAGAHHGPVSTATVSGLPGFPVENLTLENIRITYAGGGTPADAAAVPPYSKDYSPNVFKTRPAAGLFVRHARGLTLKNVDFAYETPDLRPSVVLWDAQNVTLDKFSAPRPEGVAGLAMKDVSGLTVRNSAGIPGARNEAVKEGSR